MLDKYTKINDEIKEQILFLIVDKNEGKNFIMGKDYMRFRFKTNDNLVYNKKKCSSMCNINKQCV